MFSGIFSGISTDTSVKFFLFILIWGLLLSYKLYFQRIDGIYRYLWIRKLHIEWDLSGEWHIIQINPECSNHIRIGTIIIYQNYFNIYMITEVFGVSYDKENRDIIIDDKRKYVYLENSKINENNVLDGTFQSTHVDGSIECGFHQYFIENYNPQKRPIHINGWFISIKKKTNYNDKIDDIKNGYRMMFRNKNDRNLKVREIFDENLQNITQ